MATTNNTHIRRRGLTPAQRKMRDQMHKTADPYPVDPNLHRRIIKPAATQ